MKIIFFHPYFGCGGVEKTNIRLSKYFIEQGHKVIFLSLSFADQFKPEMDEIGISYITLKATRTVQARKELRQYMKQFQADKEFVCFISCQYFANVIALSVLPRRHSNIRMIVSERSHPSGFLKNGTGMKGKVLLFLMRRLYPRADAVVANAKESAEDIEKLVGCKTFCIYNPTLTGDYQAWAKEPVEKEWFYEKTPIVISSGRLSAEKGFDTLIEAIAKVNESMKCRLVLIGDGPERDRLEELVRRHHLDELVWMPGYNSNPHKYVSKASLFVLSSHFEGLPNTLIEALAVGTPCVSTNCKSGPKEILLNGEGGLLVEVGDADGLATAIERMLENPELAEELCNKARQQLKRFTPNEVGKQYESLLLGTIHGECWNH